jgi:hypothetical protein
LTLAPCVKISLLYILIGGASLLIGQGAAGQGTVGQEATGQETSGPEAAKPEAAKQDQTPPADDDNGGRILGVIPNNKTVAPAKGPLEEPLTGRQKFKLATKDTTDPFTIVLAAFYAGIAQWQNDYPTYGQGGTGFGKRFGAAYADQGIGNYLTEAIFPALFHEDPRYFRKGSGTKWQRIDYALSRTWITRTDKGTDRFNFSEFVGNGVAAGLSNLYYPASERTVGETGEKFAVQMVSDSAFNVLLEFWPDMKHAIFKK